MIALGTPIAHNEVMQVLWDQVNELEIGTLGEKDTLLRMPYQIGLYTIKTTYRVLRQRVSFSLGMNYLVPSSHP